MNEQPAPELIDAIIKENDDWKGEVVAKIRTIILAVDPDVVEETKWKMASRPLGWPVWSHSGMVCFVEIWKDNVKLLFPKGAHVSSGAEHFNARLESKDIRALEFHEGGRVDTEMISHLYFEAVTLNTK